MLKKYGKNKRERRAIESKNLSMDEKLEIIKPRHYKSIKLKSLSVEKKSEKRNIEKKAI